MSFVSFQSNPSAFLTVLTVVLAGLIYGANAETIVIQPVADAGISSFASHANSNFGKTEDLILGAIKKGGGVGRVLLRFDLSAIPANSAILSADLSITVNREASGGGGGARHRLNRLLVDWDEGLKSGLSGQPATMGEVTWNSRKHGAEPWHLPGGRPDFDYADTMSSIQLLDGTGTYVFPTFSTLVSDIQAWVKNPDTNFGWLISSLSEDELGNVRRIRSRESATPPALTIRYTPPQMTPPILDSVRLAGNHVEIKFRALAGNLYAVEFRESLSTASAWNILTNVAEKFVDRDSVVTDSLNPGERFYRLGIVGQID